MLRRLALLGLVLLGLGTFNSACVVRETRVARPAPACSGGVWIEGRYDRWGRWHPAHWRCPGARVEIY